MRSSRRQRGFERAGRIGADRLGLPRRRARALLLATAWAEVAGDRLARRASAIAIVRGVLEIGVEDERWLETLRSLVPRLAGRLSARYPELGVRKFRLKRAGSGPAGRALELEADTGDAGPLPGPVTAGREPEEERPAADVSAEPIGARLERTIECYLERAFRR